MTPEEKALLEKHGCNCDYYGAGNCLTHNPKHPTHVIATLRAQLTQLQQENQTLKSDYQWLTNELLKEQSVWRTLQQENIELAAMVQESRNFAKWVSSEGHIVMSTACKGGQECQCGVTTARKLLNSQSPPTGYAAKVLALAGMAIKYEKAWEARKYESDGTENTLWWQQNMEATAGELLKEVKALTPEDIKLLNGGM